MPDLEPPPGAVPINQPNLPPPPGAMPIAESNLSPPTGAVPIDLNAAHPVSGRPMWHEMVDQEIQAHPGLDERGKMAVATKWMNIASPTINPQFAEQINQNLTPGQRALEYTAEGLTGFAKAGTAPMGVLFPETVGTINRYIDETEPPVANTLGNTIARGVGGALPMVATAATGATLPQFAAYGGIQAAGQAASEGKSLPSVVGHGLAGAGEAIVTGKILGGAQQLAARVANPIGRAAVATGVDVAGNAGLGAASQVGHNMVEGKPVGEGVGAAAASGAAQGLMFSPMSAHHANAQAETTRRTERVNQVLGPDHPTALAQFPGGKDGVAMREVAIAATGKEPVWYQSQSPRKGFLDKDGRIYVNADTPREALEEAFHALWRGELKPHLQKFAAENPDVVGMAADNYADHAEAAGERGIADKVRNNPDARLDEGLANTGAAAMTPEAIANVAKTNPGAFMRGYERVLGVIDRITGGNAAKGRLVERQLKQFIDPLRANVDIAREKLAAESPVMQDEATLDRLDSQMTQHARDEQAQRSQRSDELSESGRQRQQRDSIEDEESMLDRIDPQLTHAARGGRIPEPTQRTPASADDLQARPTDHPVPVADSAAEEERRQFEEEDREAARRARLMEYSHEDLRGMPDDQLRRTAQAAGVGYDARSTTVPRILDAQQRARLNAMGPKQLWDSVRALGQRAGTREQNIATLMEASRNLPAAGKTDAAPMERQGRTPPAAGSETSPPVTAPVESAAGKGAGEHQTGKPFTAEAYRGSAKGDPSEVGPNGVFFSPDPAVAKSYAGPTGRVTMETVSFTNPLVADNWVKAKEQLGLDKSDGMAALTTAAANAGHDGIVFNRHNGKPEFVKLGAGEAALRQVDNSAIPENRKPPDVQTSNGGIGELDATPTVEIRRMARDRGLDPRGTREEVMQRFAAHEAKEAGLPEEAAGKIESDATSARTKPGDHSGEHRHDDSGGAGRAQAGGQTGAAPRRASQKPYSRAGLEEKLLSHHREMNGDAGLEQYRSDEMMQDSGTDLVGPAKFTFHEKLPGEIKTFLEGRPEARSLFRVTQDAAAAHGEDVMHAMENKKAGSYFDLAEKIASGRAGELREAKEFARTSPDPTAQFMNAVHDALQGPAKERVPYKAESAAKMPPGTKFEFQGEAFRVVEDAGGMRVLKDGDTYPEVPLDWLDKVPVDKGTLKRSKAREIIPNPIPEDYSESDVTPASTSAPAKFYEPEAKAVDEATNIFGAFAPRKDTGGQAKMQFETEPAKIPVKQQEETAAEAKARKNNAGDANQLRMGEEAGIQIGPDQTKAGRTSFEVSAGDARLTVEQERPGGKTWRVMKKGQTIGEVSRATNKALAGALSRAEAQAEAERILSKQMGKPKPPEPQSLHDLPDDEIPFSVGRGGKADPVASAGAKEEADPKAPMATRLAGAVKRVIGGASRQVSIDPVPNLTAAGVGDSAVAHASAKIAAPWVVRDMIARSLPEDFKDPKASAELTDILLKNRYLGAYERFNANSQSAQADAIAKAHNLEAFDKDVKRYWNDPLTRARVEAYIDHTGQQLNQLYKEAKGAGEMPDFRAPRQGKYFDAYVPIRADIEGPAAASSEGVDDYLPKNNALNANVRKDKFDKRATYTGDFGTDLEGLLTAVVAPRLNEVSKLRFYKDLIDKGVAVEQSLENEKPSAIQGKPVASLDLRMPRYDPTTGKTTMPERRLFVRADLVREIRDVLDTDQRAPENKLAQLLTKIQVAGLADAAAHGKNMFARLLMSQGSGSKSWDIIKANPVVGIPATIAKLVKTYREISADTAQTRAELAEMAQAGLLRSPHEPSAFLAKVADATGFEWMKNLSAGDMLHHMDTASRLILNRQYSELVAQGRSPDTAQGRRDFVLRLGNYNRRLMGPWMRTFRDGGFSPFIVAARNYNRSARELLTGNAGFTGATKAQRTNARLTQLGMLASLAMTAPLVNMVMTGTPGGRDGTPTGAIDFGGDDSDGTHKTWDVLQLAGLRRGLRSTGADAAIEGLRQGKDANTIVGNAVQGITNSALHPWIGPAPSFVFKALTGRQLDIRGKMEAQTIPEGGAMQYLENLRAATESQNPLMYALTRPAFQAAGLDHKTADEEQGFLGGIGSTLAKIPAQAAGVKDARAGKDAAEDMADRLAKAHFGSASMTPEDAGKFELRTGLLAKLKSDPDAGQAAIEQAVEEGNLSEREAANLHKKAGMSALAWNVKSLGATDAAKVYEAGTDEEKEALRETLVDKVAGSKELSAGQQDALLEKLEIDPPEDLAVRRELHGLNAKAKTYNDTRKKAQAGDRTARAQLSSLRMSSRDQARRSKLQNISRAIKKAKSEGSAGAGKVKRLVAAA